ncbi:MAG: M81 family metallopeptidase [Bacteroidota bacterium]
MRLFAASLATETNTFSPIPTSLESFEAFHAPPGKHPDVPQLCTAPLLVARRRAKQEGFTLIEGSCFWAEPSGTCRRDAFETMRDRILGELKAALPVDGVLLGLHGAFVAEGYDDAEGDLIERVRALAGPKAIIGCEYDPHCHLTEKRVRGADISILFKEYPHIDFLDRGEELVELVLQTIAGKIKPVASLYDPRMADMYPTTVEPMRSFVDRIKALEGKDGVLSISIGHGFPPADVPDMGTRVLVYTDNRKAHGDALARRLGEELYAGRGRWMPGEASLEAALEKALAAQGTAILAEPDDNAGGGAASDNTLVIHELRRRGIKGAAVAPLWDPVGVEFCFMAGVGARFPLRFGGKACHQSGPPVDAEVEVLALAADTWQSFGAARVPLGNAAAIRVDGGIDVILITHRTQALGRELFTHLGRDPAAYRLLVLKSAQHFAGAFGPLAEVIVRAPTGGSSAYQATRLAYARVKRPLWPLDEVVEGRMLV